MQRSWPTGRVGRVVRAAALAAGFVTLGVAGTLAQDNLVVMGHAVHRDTATTGPGGDVTEDWRNANGVTIEWITLGTGPLRERLFREVSLGQTAVDIGFLLNTQITPQIANLFEPLDAYLESKPIDDFEDIAPGTVAAVTFDGEIYAIPYRQATQGLHINTEILAERGLEGSPKTVEELLDYARQLSFTRDDGTRVYGLVLGAYTHQLALLLSMGGEFVTEDYQMTDDVDGLVEYFRTIRALFEEGVLPEAMTTFDQNTPLEWMQQGRTAMVIYPTARNVQMNDPETALYPGATVTLAVPASEESGLDAAPGVFEFWAMAIPRNSVNKDAAWSLIQHLSTPENTVREALNGNGPIRISAFDDPMIQENIPYADQERLAFMNGAAAIPAFDNATRVSDIWKETFEAAMLGFLTPEEAAADLVTRVTLLLPS